MKKEPEGLHSSPPRYLLSLDRELLKLKILKAIDTKYTNLEFTRLILKTDTRTPAITFASCHQGVLSVTHRPRKETVSRLAQTRDHLGEIKPKA